MTVATAAPPARGPSSRGERLAAVAAAAAAVSIYAPVAAGLVRQWYEDPNAAYGALVAIAAVFAMRQRWRRLTTLPREGSWLGLAGLAAAAILYAAGTLAADLFLLRISFVAFGAAVVWFVWGTPALRVMAVPIVLAAAAIPLPNALVTELTLPLQLGASQLATVLLGAVGIDVIRDGNVLTLSYITLEVAEACSGMRSLVTLLALVAVYWGTSGATLTRAAILAVAAVPVALAGNGLRVAFTAVLAGRIGENAVRGFAHDATGFVTFLVMGAALVGVHLLSSRTSRAAGLAA
jgi:exosortase